VFTPFNAEGAYRVYLKNGQVISGVEEATEHEETIQIFKNGITLKLQKSNVDRVESYDVAASEEEREAEPVTAGEKLRPDLSVIAPGQQLATEPEKLRRSLKQKARDNYVTQKLKAIEQLEKRSKELRLLGRKKWSPRKARLARQEKAEIDRKLEALEDEKEALLKEKKKLESRID
jgi:hypothetical protein